MANNSNKPSPLDFMMSKYDNANNNKPSPLDYMISHYSDNNNVTNLGGVDVRTTREYKQRLNNDGYNDLEAKILKSGKTTTPVPSHVKKNTDRLLAEQFTPVKVAPTTKSIKNNNATYNAKQTVPNSKKTVTVEGSSKSPTQKKKPLGKDVEKSLNKKVNSNYTKEDIAKRVFDTLVYSGTSPDEAAKIIAKMDATAGLDPGCVMGNTSGDRTISGMKSKDLSEYTKQQLLSNYGNGASNKINEENMPGSDQYLAKDGRYYPPMGIGQWRGEEARRMLAYAEKMGVNWNDPDFQVKYLSVVGLPEYKDVEVVIPSGNGKKIKKLKEAAEKKKKLNDKKNKAIKDKANSFTGQWKHNNKKNNWEPDKEYIKSITEDSLEINRFHHNMDSGEVGQLIKDMGGISYDKRYKKRPPVIGGSDNLDYAPLSELRDLEGDFNSINKEALYTSIQSSNKGKTSLKIKNVSSILGMPPQFLASADPKLTSSTSEYIGDENEIGRVYTEKIIKYMPLLLIIPGIPDFMRGFTKAERNAVFSNHFLKARSKEFEDVMNFGNGKYYSLKPDLEQYYGYVDTMLRAAAIMLEIGDEEFNGTRLRKIRWREVLDSGATGQKGLFNQYRNAIPFYADCGNDVSETFSNSTTQSGLAGSLQGLSDQGRELNFLMGIAGGASGIRLDKWLGQENLSDNIEATKDMIGRIMGSRNNIFSNVISKMETIATGGRIVFPEIWSDSSFGRSYSCRMKLVSLGGDPLSIYFGILTTVFHLLGLTLPRFADGQAYYAPFIIRAYYKGMFNINMGMITDLSVTKGAEGEWSIHGIPTVAEVSFTIKDLYESMSMVDDKKFGVRLMSNVAELDYIANSCGININDGDIGRTISLIAGLMEGKVTNIPTKMFRKVQEYFTNKVANIFGVFK